jgi:hypothetical protein
MKHPRLRLILAIGLLAVFVANCGAKTPSTSNVGTAATGDRFSPQPSWPPVPSGTIRYTVTTYLLSVKGGPVYGCWSVLTSDPPAGCGGFLVRGVDIRQVPGSTIYGNGTVSVAMAKLVGIWENVGLTLTEAPKPTKAFEATPFGLPCNGAGTMSEPRAQAVKTSIDFDTTLSEHGIQVLDAQLCGHTVRVVLALADRSAVDYITQRYGQLEISGWLQPVGE